MFTLRMRSNGMTYIAYENEDWIILRKNKKKQGLTIGICYDHAKRNNLEKQYLL